MENRMNEQFFFSFVSFLFIATKKNMRNHTVKVQMVNNACSCWNKRGESNITVSWNLKFRNFTSIRRQLWSAAQNWSTEKNKRKKNIFTKWWWNTAWKKNILKWKCELKKNRHDIIWLIGIPVVSYTATDDDFDMDDFNSGFYYHFIFLARAFDNNNSVLKM